jgi:predicted PurR-regulated permease PerM
VFSLDDRAGNVVTTVAVFMAAAAILYLAREAFLVLLLSLLFAYLIEPAVAWVQNHSRLGRKNRAWAIAQVYLLGALVLGSLGFKFVPYLAGQLKNLSAAVPGILKGLSTGTGVADLEGRHGFSAAEQLRIQDALARHHDFIVRTFEEGAEVAAYAVASTI